MQDLQNGQDVSYEGSWCGFLPENNGNANIYQTVNLKKNTNIN